MSDGNENATLYNHKETFDIQPGIKSETVKMIILQINLHIMVWLPEAGVLASTPGEHIRAV